MRAEIQLLRKYAEEDRTAENNILSQANQQAEMFAKALAAAPAGCTAALGTVVDPRLPIVFGGRGVRSGGVTGVGSGTAGLDYPRPPAVSKPKCNNAVGGKADAAAAAARGGGEKEAALTRVKSLFAALKTVGNGQGGATVVTTASGIPSIRAVGASAVGASAAGASAGGASTGGGDVGGGNVSGNDCPRLCGCWTESSDGRVHLCWWCPGDDKEPCSSGDRGWNDRARDNAIG